MQDDKQSTVSPSPNAAYSETYNSINADLDTEIEGVFDSYTYSSVSNIAVLQARLSAMEARESAGLGSDKEIKILRARLALAQAKNSADPNGNKFEPSSLPSPNSSPATRKTQKLTASRVLQPHEKDDPIANTLQFFSSICAVAGGVLLSSNTSVSKYGFILLACSSSQLFLSSLILKQKSLMVYGASLFFLVDCLGIYRWLLEGSI